MTVKLSLLKCPTHGDLVITSSLNLVAVSSPPSHLSETIMIQNCTVSPLEPITPIDNVIRALEASRKDLLRQEIHPTVNTFIGVPTEQLELIDIVVARMEGRQKSLLTDDLSQLALEERDQYDKLVQSLEPLLAHFKDKDPSAEVVVKLLSETGQPDHARRILVGNVSGAPSADALHAQLKSNEDLRIPKRSFKSERPYTLGLIANGSNMDQMNGTATIIKIPIDWPLFSDSKRSKARISLKFLNPNQLRIFSLCQAFGIEFEARITPSIKLGTTDLVFEGTVIDYFDLPKLLEEIQVGKKNFVGDLFAPMSGVHGDDATEVKPESE
jgi:hypothetical protein